MERYEKPYMEVIDIEDELTTTLGSPPGDCNCDGYCFGDSIGPSIGPGQS